jgi:hypothetical protein
MAGRHDALITLALEIDVEAHEAVNSCDALAVNSTITAPTSDLDLDEAGLAQEALNEALK